MHRVDDRWCSGRCRALGARRIFHSYVVSVVLGTTFLLGRARDKAMLGHSAVDSLRDSTFPSQPMSIGPVGLRGPGMPGCGRNSIGIDVSRGIKGNLINDRFSIATVKLRMIFSSGQSELAPDQKHPIAKLAIQTYMPGRSWQYLTGKWIEP